MNKDLILREVRIYLGQSINSLFVGIPMVVYIVLLLGLMAGLISIFISKLIVKNRVKAIGQLLLVEYVVLTYCSTVWFRSCNVFHGYNFRLFWSYQAFLEGQNAVLVDNIMNVAVFIPVGLLCGIAFKKMKWKHMLMIAILLSVSIEAMQFVLNRGFAEFDDVFHNVIGCLIGFGLYKLVYALYERVSKMRLAVL